MEMHQLRYFLAAARTLNFTHAAQICHVSQPALTMAIRKLEQRFGGLLFHREGRRLLLTELGRRMQPHCALILEQIERAVTVAENFRLLDQVPIRLGVMSTIGPVRVAGVLAAFEHECPRVDVAVHEGPRSELASKLESDELDLAIVNPLDGVENTFRSEPIYSERYVVLLPPEHPLLDRDALSLADLAEEPYVDRLSCEMREVVMGAIESRGLKLYARFRSEREDWIEAMVRARIGFAFMPEYSVVHSQSLCRPLVDPVIERSVSLISQPGRRYPPAVAAFVRTARSRRWA